MGKMVERFEDMSERGRLRIRLQDDGDILVCVISDPNGPNEGNSTSVEFCIRGGKSPKTLEALRLLMNAMEEDNRGNPNCDRRGERGMWVD